MTSIFWSWQSDLDARVTRDVVRDALAFAIADLHAELDERVELTSDTKGVAGSPDIVATILAKIEAAAVFVGDVTPIATAATGKAVANPNVLIELGYAKKALGLERVILIWNTAFEGATPERLPFDMRGRRAPIGFSLAPNATKAELRIARAELQAVLVEALRASIAVSAPVVIPTAPQWQACPTSPALWFDPTVPLLINEDGEAGKRTIHPGPYRYVRILPAKWTPPAGFGGIGHAPLLGPTNGFSWGTGKGGALTYPGSLRAGTISTLSNLTFQSRATGELWGADAQMSARGNFFADAVIKSFNDFVDDGIAHLQKQGARGPFEIKLGVTQIGGLRWTSDGGWGGSPQALEETAEAHFSLKGSAEAERLDALEEAWGKIAAAFGLTQPSRASLVKQIRGF